MVPFDDVIMGCALVITITPRWSDDMDQNTGEISGAMTTTQVSSKQTALVISDIYRQCRWFFIIRPVVAGDD